MCQCGCVGCLWHVGNLWLYGSPVAVGDLWFVWVTSGSVGHLWWHGPPMAVSTSFPGSLLFPPPGAREERPWLGLVTCLLGICNPNEGSPVLPGSCCVTFSKHQPWFLNDLMFATSRPTRRESFTFILGIDQVYDNEYSTQFPHLWITRIYSPSSTEKWQTL